MKYSVKFFVITILFFCSNYAIAENKIAFVDMNKVILESDVGKYLETELNKTHKLNIKNFEKTEVDLKQKEKDLMSKRNILKKEDFEAKIINLRKELKLYQDDRKERLSVISTKKNNGLKTIFQNLQPILSTYSQENSISIMLDKKNILVGKSELDATDIIIKALNKKIKKIDLN
tara:strand:+ start:220 stop:744 length:525 start_codon:yes stop_codon:yes gene_type:complete